MKIFALLFDPAILIVLVTFVSIVFYYLKKILFVKKELKNLVKILKNFNKSDLAFRFKELDTMMSSNQYICKSWTEFKNTLMFTESLSLTNEESNKILQDISNSTSGIQTTVDPIYFFNEESLVTSKMNYKFIQTVPTILTGLGPLFTFLKIAITFACVNFATQADTINSVSKLMSGMQVAALCSVLAVGSSIIFLVLERITYNTNCKLPLANVQNLFYDLFDNISSEKFLIELLKETKVQNITTKNMISAIPKAFQKSFDESLKKILVPYLENLALGVNKLQSKRNGLGGNGGDIVDNLFK